MPALIPTPRLTPSVLLFTPHDMPALIPTPRLLASTTAFQVVPSLPVSASPAGKRCAQPVLVDLPSLPSLPELPEPPDFLKNFLRKDTSLLGSQPRGKTGQFKRGFDKYGRLQRADGKSRPDQLTGK